MKYCTYCGTCLKDDNCFCPNCGSKCNDNKNSNNSEYTIPYERQANNFNHKEEDKSNGGLNLISFFLPLVGLILFLIWQDDYPLKAKGCGKWALIGVVTSFVISIVAIVFFRIIFGSIWSDFFTRILYEIYNF